MDASNEDALGHSAEVVANRCRIRYHRHGSGSPVILLRPPELAASVDAAVLDGLAARFRVLVPVAAEPTEATREDRGGVASAGTGARDGVEALDGVEAQNDVQIHDDVLRWLTCFVEGLGIMDGGMVAVGRYRSAALALVAALPEQLARVVLLDASGVDEHEAPSRVLRVEGDAGRARSALPRILSFLLGEEDSRAA